MSKRLSILWLTLPLLLTSCSKEIWHENIKSEDFATLDRILLIALLAGLFIWVCYHFVSKCLIPILPQLVAEAITSGDGLKII